MISLIEWKLSFSEYRKTREKEEEERRKKEEEERRARAEEEKKRKEEEKLKKAQMMGGGFAAQPQGGRWDPWENCRKYMGIGEELEMNIWL